MNGSKILHLTWVLVLCLVVMIAFKYKREATSFYGIAEAKEMVVNSDKAVEATKIHVVPGQIVKKNQLLIELFSPEMTKSISDISQQLVELTTLKKQNSDELKSRINQLKAEKATKTSSIKNQIKLLQAQYNLNKELASSIKSWDTQHQVSDTASAKNPILLKIQGLEGELTLSVNAMMIEIRNLEDKLNSIDASVIQKKIEGLNKKLNLLLAEQKKLHIRAQTSALVSTVTVNSGEKITPFTPLLTLHSQSPTFVNGYIHENVYNRVSIGDKVTISSLVGTNGHPEYILGEVVGVGGRIVTFPERLRKSPDIQLWGREVVIKIPENNHFLLGEKVKITS